MLVTIVGQIGCPRGEIGAPAGGEYEVGERPAGIEHVGHDGSGSRCGQVEGGGGEPVGDFTHENGAARSSGVIGDCNVVNGSWLNRVKACNLDVRASRRRGRCGAKIGRFVYKLQGQGEGKRRSTPDRIVEKDLGGICGIAQGGAVGGVVTGPKRAEIGHRAPACGIAAHERSCQQGIV